MKPLADYLGVSIEECARQILQKAYEKIEPVILGFAEKYKIEHDQISLVGVGGGASALLPFTAESMKLNYSIPQYAEVISSIGVALAMVRDVVERVVPNPTSQDIADIKKEAKTMAIKSGAVADSIEVQIEVDPQTSKITAIALGSTEVKTTDLLKACDEKEARELAAASMNMPPSMLELEIQNDIFYLFTAVKDDKKQLRLLDKKGFVKIQRGDAEAVEFAAADWEEETEKLWKRMLTYRAEMERTPDLYLCIEGKVLDYANTISLEQLKVIMGTEFIGVNSEERVILVGARSEL